MRRRGGRPTSWLACQSALCAGSKGRGAYGSDEAADVGHIFINCGECNAVSGTFAARDNVACVGADNVVVRDAPTGGLDFPAGSKRLREGCRTSLTGYAS